MLGVNEIMLMLKENEQQAKNVLNLVPSESFYSPLAKIPFLLDCYHRYFFNITRQPDKWDFRGSELLSIIETDVAIPLLKEFTKAAYVDVRPLSGMHAMLIVLAGMTKIGDCVFCLSQNLGGHYATHPNAERFGLSVIDIVGPDPHTIDLDDLKHKARSFLPRLVYIDQCFGLFPFNIKEIVDVIRSVSPSTIIHVDASHWLGLIFGGALPNPLEEGADSFGGSTHKTFPGPHKGIFATNNPKLNKAIIDTQFVMTSNHNFAGVISLALCLLDFKENGGRSYISRIVQNTKNLGACLSEKGLTVIGKNRGYSSGHQLWVCTEILEIPAQLASDRLYNANIRVNCLPYIPGFEGRPALRLGLAETTYKGFNQKEIEQLSTIIIEAIKGQDPISLKVKISLMLKEASMNEFSRPYDMKFSEQLTQLINLCLGREANSSLAIN